tara:strand:- start:61 stop:897 length:837 start_codon:yes stop_codon:yes gene_type:complete
MHIINKITYYFDKKMFTTKHSFIDKGAFGYVYKITINNMNYAIKIFKENKLNYINKNELSFAEKYIKDKHNHSNIVKYLSIGKVIEPTNLNIHNKTCIVMKYYIPLDKHLIHLMSNKLFNVNTIIDILIDIFTASKWLINNFNLIHADIKIDNILVDPTTNNYVLSDFGITADSNRYYYCNNKFAYSGDISMYPYYNCYYNKFVMYSIGVLLLNVMGISTDIISNMNKYNYVQNIKSVFESANINDLYLMKILKLMIEYNHYSPSYMNYYINKYEKSK